MIHPISANGWGWLEQGPQVLLGKVSGSTLAQEFNLALATSPLSRCLQALTVSLLRSYRMNLLHLRRCRSPEIKAWGTGILVTVRQILNAWPSLQGCRALPTPTLMCREHVMACSSLRSFECRTALITYEMLNKLGWVDKQMNFSHKKWETCLSLSLFFPGRSWALSLI